MKPLFFLLFLSTAFLASCQQGPGDSSSRQAMAARVDAGAINEVLPLNDYKAKMQELGAGLQVIDVRTPDEYKQGHIEGAININFYSRDFTAQLEKALQKEKPVLLYCRSGGRSAKAARQMEAMGFRELYDLKGGYLKWK